MIISLIGPQGCGKGTVGEKLGEKLNIPLISVGDILRAIPENDPDYTRINDAMKQGILVPQDAVSALIKKRISQDDCANGYILDGWLRNMIDVSFFEPPLDHMIYMKIPRETSLARLSSRRTCSICKKVFNIVSVPPKVEDVCDDCGGKLMQREDDTPVAINKRLDIFYTDTQLVLDYFRNKGILLEVDATPLPNEVFQNVLTILNLK